MSSIIPGINFTPVCAVTHKLLELVCVLVSSNTESIEKVRSHNFIRFEDVECVFDGQMMDDSEFEVGGIEMCSLGENINNFCGGGWWALK